MRRCFCYCAGNCAENMLREQESYDDKVFRRRVRLWAVLLRNCVTYNEICNKKLGIYDVKSCMGQLTFVKDAYIINTNNERFYDALCDDNIGG